MDRSSKDANARAAIRECAASLPFSVDELDFEECLATADALESAAETLYSSDRADEIDPVESEQGNDEHGSLLSVYRNPSSSERSGLLSGVRIGIKDNVAVRGLPMTCGSDTVSFVPSYDAAVVERLRNAGATIVGKTNMDAFGFGPSGEFSEQKPVRNPVLPDRVPGGSSSGSGAAVAAGFLDVGIGTDTGGSVRIPAACCGVVGVKPTHGLVPRHGLVGFAPSLDTIGPLARDVSTAATGLEAMAGHDVRDPSSIRAPRESLTELRTDIQKPLEIGIATPFFERSTEAVSAAIESALDGIEDHPSITVSMLDFDLGRIEEAYYLTGATEFAWLLRQDGIVRGQGTGYEEQWRHAFVKVIKNGTLSSHVAERVLPSIYLDEKRRGKAYTAARRETIAFVERLDNCFDNVDLLLMPTIRSLPPKPGRINASERLNDLLGNTAPFNLSGMPAVSLPVAVYDGVPVSAQVVAPRFADNVALTGAHLIERAVGLDWPQPTV